MDFNEKKRLYLFYGGQLERIQTQISYNNKPNPFQLNQYTIGSLNSHGLDNAEKMYKSDDFNDFIIDFSNLTLYDVIKGYYDIETIPHELLRLKRNVKTEEIEFIFTHKHWNGKLFELLYSKLSFARENFYKTIKEISSKIKDIFKRYHFDIPKISDINDDLIDYYMEVRNEKRKYLPDINELLINDTLYLINYVHGTITETHKTVHIPETMDFYRIITSEYGSVACTTPDEVTWYIDKMNDFLKTHRKNTYKNNIKRIKRLIPLLFKKTQKIMGKRRKNGFISTQKEKERYDKTKPHIHHFKGSNMIFKNYHVYFNRNDPFEWSTITIVNPKLNVNLLDYIDIKPIRGKLKFNMNQIMDIIKDIKFVLFIDLSCSSTIENKPNQELNNYKRIANEIEGKSITNEIDKYLNLSPYNESPIPLTQKHLSLTSKDSRSQTRSTRLSF